MYTLSDLADGKPLRDENELVGDIGGGMELARGIEPPTGGLQIGEREVAQVVDGLGNLRTWSGKCVQRAVGRACCSVSRSEGVCLAA